MLSNFAFAAITISHSVLASLDVSGEAANQATEAIKKINIEDLSTESIVAWVVAGAVVGNVVGTVFMKGAGRVGAVVNLLIGGIGAAIGATVVKEFKIDFGWPRVSFSLEALVIAVVAAVVLVVMFRSVFNLMHSAAAAAKTTRGGKL